MRSATRCIVFIIFLGVSTPVFASTIRVDLKVNGKSDSVTVRLADVLRVQWKSEGSEEVKECRGTGIYDTFYSDQYGGEWVNAALPTSGSAQVKITNWDNARGSGLDIYCWLGDWPNKAAFGENVARARVEFLDTRIILTRGASLGCSPSVAPPERKTVNDRIRKISGRKVVKGSPICLRHWKQ